MKYSKVIKLLVFIGFFGIVLMFGHGTASATTWPQNGWGTGVNASIDLHRNENHNTGDDYIPINFRAYSAGNTVGQPLTVNIVYEKVGAAGDGCDLSGDTRLAIYEYNDLFAWIHADRYESCAAFDDSHDNRRSITLQNGVWRPGLNMTEYSVGVALENAKKGSRFRFDAQADGVEFGFGKDGDLYFSIDGGGGDEVKNISIPVCVSESGIKGFRSYDPDNVPRSGGGVQPGVLYDMALKSSKSGVLKKANSTEGPSGSGFGWSWNNPAQKRYMPIYGSDVHIKINFDMQKDKKYEFQINNLGVNNYVSINMPGREVCDPIVNPDWDIDSVSAAVPNVIYKGESTTFQHRAYNMGPLSTDEDVDVDMIRNWPGGGGEWWALDLGINTPAGAGRPYNDPQTFNTIGNYTEYVRVEPENDDDEDPNFTNTSSATAYVVQPTATTNLPNGYEKGTGGVVTINHTISINPCPPSGYSRNVRWNISGIEGNGTAYNQWVDTTLGNGDCSRTIPKQLNGSWLDNQKVGVVANYNTIAPAPFGNSPGVLTVYEVPFARFYGNDIYATNGDIRFNDAGDSNIATVQRGSVDQYAALAFGTVKIDTSSFRTLPIPAPNPPNGLDAPNSRALSGASADSVYTNVSANVPESGCGLAESSYLLPTSSGCYYIKDDYHLTGIPRIGGSDGITCQDKNRLNPAHKCDGPDWPNGFEYITSDYNQKITLLNPDPNKPLMIVGDIINTTLNYSDPSNTGVLLIVSAGDIIIDNNVKRIDAVLVTNKTIHTCGWTWGSAYGSKVGQSDIEDVCRDTLTINGAVSAKTIDFRRAVGTRYLNPQGDTFNGYANCRGWAGIKNCTARGNGLDDNPANANRSGGAAEIINFPAYLYFAKPYLKDQSVPGSTVESLFAAPPRL